MPRATLVVLLVLAALPIAAQETSAPADKPDPKWGIGVSMSPMALFIGDDFGFLPIGISNVMVPIRMGSGTTLEPEFGLLRISSSSGGGGFSTLSKFSNARFGVGVLADMGEREALRPYIGGRVGIMRTRTETQSTGSPLQTVKQNNWYMTGVLGAQHFFSPHFSLGGEAQISRTSVGDTQVTGGGGSGSDDQSFMSTGGVVMLRWFF